MKIKKSAFILVILILFGCTQITQPESEDIAIKFINKNVKFFSKGQNSTNDVSNYEVSNIKSYKQNNNWFVMINITSEVDGDIKHKILMVEVNSKNGDVLSFDGKKLKQ